MSKTVYQFDDNGVYLFPVEADESPLEPGVYLFPRNTTETEPPKIDQGETAVWSGTAWQVVKNQPIDPADVIIDFFAANPDVWKYVCNGVKTKTQIIK